MEEIRPNNGEYSGFCGGLSVWSSIGRPFPINRLFWYEERRVTHRAIGKATPTDLICIKAGSKAASVGQQSSSSNKAYAVHIKFVSQQTLTFSYLTAEVGRNLQISLQYVDKAAVFRRSPACCILLSRHSGSHRCCLYSRSNPTFKPSF